MTFPRPPIPGGTPLDDISGLRIRSITSQAALNEAEAANILKAVTKYLAARPSKRAARFDVAWMKRLHAEMFGDVWNWAGTLRKHNPNIGCDWPVIEQELYALSADHAARVAAGMPLIEQAAWLHHRAVQIHPFKNGNGRWSRLLANIWLKRSGESITEWPEQVIGAESAISGIYLQAMKAADAYDMQPLIALHHQYTPRQTDS